MIKRDAKINNKWNATVRKNIEETHVVADEYKNANSYAKKQIIQTEVPTADNFMWGGVKINNPQNIVKNYAEAVAQ